MIQTLTLIAAFTTLLLLAWLAWRFFHAADTTSLLEEKHRAMLLDLHDGLNKLGDRLNAASGESGERLRMIVAQELKETRDAMQALQLSQSQNLAETRVTVLEKLHTTLAEQGKAEQTLIQDTMHKATAQLTGTIEALTKAVDGRLEQIGGKVSERLDEGFKKTNQTFIDVMTHLSRIDEAQKKIDGLATNVVSLQDLLSDKRSRGAFGEVQLEGLVRNSLPPNSYEFQYSLGENKRVDCMLFLPEPTGNVAVDSKFPLENYHRMFEVGAAESDRIVAKRQFKSDVRKHVDDIAKKYIIPDVTSDGAVMFIPAEAVFAEIHAYHPEIIIYAMSKRVWLVSPTTLMAVLNTARAVLKDTEMRKQVHIIQSELNKLGKDFGLFNKRMEALASHIRLASKDVDEVHISSRKIAAGFAKIESVELTVKEEALPVEDLDDLLGEVSSPIEDEK
jgi:DNA recombination protein RmuC